MFEYFAAHIIICIIPALFTAGAIDTFLSRSRILKLFNDPSTPLRSYVLAAVSGFVLTVTSGGVFALFAAIYHRRAGEGPAFSFLYSGPAINVVAAALTFRVLGWEFGLARSAAAIVFSLAIGLVMSVLWRRSEHQVHRIRDVAVEPDYPDDLSPARTAVFFTLLVATLVLAIGQSYIRTLIPAKDIWGEVLSWVPAGLGLIGVVIAVKAWFSRRDLKMWLARTWEVTKRVIGRLAIGVFLIGIFETFVPAQWISVSVGGNGILANAVSAVFGSLMYFATVTEVPLTNTLVRMGMGAGPALALLLAGPALSLPSMLKLGRYLKGPRTLVYIFLVILSAIVSGLAFGALLLLMNPGVFGV